MERGINLELGLLTPNYIEAVATFRFTPPVPLAYSTVPPLVVQGLREVSKCRQESFLLDHTLLGALSGQEKVVLIQMLTDSGHQLASSNSQDLLDRS